MMDTSHSMADSLKRSIRFDTNSPVPLRQQLHDGLKAWVEGLEIGARLPPERTLATIIGVSRVTVKNALGPLARQGVLRRSVKGTFVARRPSELGGGSHPLMRQPGLPASGRVLTVASYECWPAQQRAWQSLVTTYNRSQGAARVAVEIIPQTVGTPEAYSRYLSERRADIAMLSYDAALLFRDRGLLAPLPEDVSRALRGPDYASFIPGADAHNVLSWVAPLHFGVWGALWNRDLAGEFPRPKSPAFRLSDLVGRVVAAAGRPRRGECLVCDSLAMFLAAGHPAAGGPARRNSYARQLAGLARRLVPASPGMLWPEPYDPGYTQRFLNGHAAFFAGGLHYILQRLPGSLKNWGGAFLSPEPPFTLTSGWTSVGLPAATASEEAGDFVRFLVSPPAQEIIARSRLNAAFYWPANRHLVDFISGSSLDQLRSAVAGQAFMSPGEHDDWQSYLARDLFGSLREIAAGRMSVKAALAAADRATGAEDGGP